MNTLQLISGSVGEEINSNIVRDFLKKNKGKDVQFDVSTLGGNLNEGLIIYDLISSHRGKTICNIVGLTASAGTVIAMGCDEIKMSSNALFLIHNGWTDVTGNVYDFQKAASQLARTDAIMVRIYKEKTGLEEEKIKSLMKDEDWLTPGEALSMGFVDSINYSDIKVAASVIMTGARGKIKDVFLQKLQNKMNIFNKKTKVCKVLALKNGKNIVVNAQEVATGVEVAADGEASLEDGTYELSDGRTISVSDGAITEVTEKKKEEETNMDIDAVVSAVAEVVDAKIEAIKADFDAKLGKISSTHKPPQGNQVSGGKAKAQSPQAFIKEALIAKQKEIEDSRKA